MGGEIGVHRVVDDQGQLFDGAPRLLPHQGGQAISPDPIQRAAIASHERSIQERFEAFHEANPRVYAVLVRLAREAVEHGRPRLGMKHLWEVARWQSWTSTEGDPFKLPNDYTSRYSRLIMANEPDLAGYFETRELRA